MDIKLNENNEITAYAVVGGVDGIEVSDDKMPEDFRDKFESKFYIYEDDEIKENPDYEPPKEEESKPAKYEIVELLVEQNAREIKAIRNEIDFHEEESNEETAKNFLMIGTEPLWLVPDDITQDEYDELKEKYLEKPQYD